MVNSTQNSTPGSTHDWGNSGDATPRQFGENFPDLTASDTLAHKATKAVEDAADSARATVSNAAESVGEATDKAIAAGKDGFAAIEDFVKANPIPVLVGTAAAGALIALLIANKGRSRRSEARNWVKEMSRYTDDVHHALRREMRSALNDERVSRLVSSIPTAEVSKAVSPWIAQAIEALTSAKDQAQATVANAAGKVHDKLS